MPLLETLRDIVPQSPSQIKIQLTVYIILRAITGTSDNRRDPSSAKRLLQ
jgi:hypothetical protein